ncbi:MAG: chemotaxis response regulator protein-glutamate methylesterase [Clostridiales Family XIII bacterium]|jgi:two-component system chemotaxis response regulator CheB|nr:chemotaxis response regulator protein-glutamate methylesterase [Clostridiales Family XIII bacterium]
MISNIRVLIVDDSLVFREALARELRKEAYIIVVGTAADPFEASDKIIALNPDVMTLDVEMPKMDGIEFLLRLLPQYPIPVIVSSSLAGKVFDAMAAGAVDFVAKPGISYDGAGASTAMEAYAKELANKIKAAAGANVSIHRQAGLQNSQTATGHAAHHATGHAANHGAAHGAFHHTYHTWTSAPTHHDAAQAAGRQLTALYDYSDELIAVGASTGGTEAIFSILTQLPANAPGIVMVQHMPQGFTKLYSERLDRACAIRVKEAEDNDQVRSGLALLAPGGDRQMKLVRTSSGYSVKLVEGEKVSGHRPSVDFLFDSVAAAAGGRAIGVLLTGMGADGAKGLLKMRNGGAYTIGQDEASCVVYGMPMAAYKMGAVVKQLPLDQIAREICGRLSINHMVAKNKL